MKSLFTRIKPGRNLEAKQGETDHSLSRQKQLLELKACLASGSPLNNESGFATAVEGLRELIAMPEMANKGSQQVEKIGRAHV